MNNMEKNKKYGNVVTFTIIMLLFSVFLLVFGVTYAAYTKFFKGTTNNIIEAGMISFSYDEDLSEYNGIKLDNAYPKNEAAGRVQSARNEYFDFSISATTTLADIPYQIYLVKQEGSTLGNEWVKVYLTLKNGTTEIPSDLVLDEMGVLTYDELEGSSNEKLIYNGVVKQYSGNYLQNFRLRMWVTDEINVNGNQDFYGKSFSARVKVTAVESN